MARALGKRGGEGDLREQRDAAGARNCHRDPGLDVSILLRLRERREFCAATNLPAGSLS